MKKLFTFAAALLTSFSLFAGTYKTYALTDLTQDGSTYEVTGLSSNDQKLNKGERLVEVPSATTEGTLYLSGTGANADRFASIYKENGTVYDGDRQIAMTSGYNPIGIDFNASDLLEQDGKYYIVFGSSADYKINAFKYTLADPTKATVKSISVNGEAISGFDAATLSYDVELAFGTTELPVVAATTGNGATVQITQATALPGSATVVCTSQDGTSETKTYTINFTVAATASTDATLKSLSVNGAAVAGFAADVYEYTIEFEYDALDIPVVAAEKNEEHANAVINQATTLPGVATVVVTAQDGTTVLTYTLNFAKEALTPIIRATHTGGKTADVKGSIGGTADKNTQNDGKLGSNGHYFGITLANDQQFLAGDSIVILASALVGGNNATLFTEKEGTNAIIEDPVPFDLETMRCIYVLTANVDAIYVVRKDGAVCNPSIKSISVYRQEGGETTAINNTEAGVKAVKFFQNGQLMIEKNGVVYNAQGAIVK